MYKCKIFNNYLYGKNFILQNKGMDMCTYWENAVKEFFKKQELERNKRAASKS